MSYHSPVPGHPDVLSFLVCVHPGLGLEQPDNNAYAQALCAGASVGWWEAEETGDCRQGEGACV